MHDIIGFTLAETAFVLLFAVFAGLLSGKAQEANVTRQASDQLTQIARLQQDLNSSRQNNAQLSARIAALMPKLRSAAFPSCAETGRVQGWLFTATVNGRDSYEIDGVPFTALEIIKKYSSQLREASDSACRQRIRLYVGDRVSGEEYEFAMRQIGQYFYIGYMGSK
jgi:hypothetical protein